MFYPAWVWIFVPTIAILLNAIIFSAQTIAVLQARKLQSLGSLNPYPFAFSLFGSFGWMLYGILLHDMFLFWSSFPGFSLSIFNLTSAMELLASRRNKDEEILLRNLERILMGGVVFWGMLAMIISQCLVHIDDGMKITITMVGFIDCAGTVMFLGSPLATVRVILKSRDASSLYPPLVIGNATSGTLWLIYGLLRNDPFIWTPNVVGLTITSTQLFLLAIYPRHLMTKDTQNNINIGDNQNIIINIADVSPDSSNPSSSYKENRTTSKKVSNISQKASEAVSTAVKTSVKLFTPKTTRRYSEVEGTGDLM